MGPLGDDLGHEGGALMNGISALTKETPKSSSPLLPCEDTVRRWLSTKHTWALTRHQICRYLDLGLPTCMLAADVHPRGSEKSVPTSPPDPQCSEPMEPVEFTEPFHPWVSLLPDPPGPTTLALRFAPPRMW